MRRLHVPTLFVGRLMLAAPVAHHARDVLRLPTGERVELFDDAGSSATGVLEMHPAGVAVVVAALAPAATLPGEVVIASAVPKGDRADWLVEKLSELQVARWVPLRTARSVVHPQGRGKTDRWTRIAVEAARQSGRVGVMTIDPLTSLKDALRQDAPRKDEPQQDKPRQDALWTDALQKDALRQTAASHAPPRVGRFVCSTSPGRAGVSLGRLIWTARYGSKATGATAPAAAAGSARPAEAAGEAKVLAGLPKIPSHPTQIDHTSKSPTAAVARDAFRGVTATDDAALPPLPLPPAACVFIGPEGGWTDDEESAFDDAGLTRCSLGPTTLRIETAAVAAAALFAAHYA